MLAPWSFWRSCFRLESAGKEVNLASELVYKLLTSLFCRCCFSQRQVTWHADESRSRADSIKFWLHSVRPYRKTIRLKLFQLGPGSPLAKWLCRYRWTGWEERLSAGGGKGNEKNEKGAPRWIEQSSFRKRKKMKIERTWVMNSELKTMNTIQVNKMNNWWEKKWFRIHRPHSSSMVVNRVAANAIWREREKLIIGTAQTKQFNDWIWNSELNAIGIFFQVLLAIRKTAKLKTGTATSLVIGSDEEQQQEEGGRPEGRKWQRHQKFTKDNECNA